MTSTITFNPSGTGSDEKYTSSRREFNTNIRTLFQGFSKTVPIAYEGIDIKVFKEGSSYILLSIESDNKGPKNIKSNERDYDTICIQRVIGLRLRVVTPNQDTTDEVIESLTQYIETTEFKYLKSKFRINILQDFDVKTFKDVSPYNESKYVSIGVLDFTATYINTFDDYVGTIIDMEAPYGLDDGGVYYHDTIIFDHNNPNIRE